MIKSSIEKLSEEIGYDIGHSDDATQAKLLNGLSRGLNKIKGLNNNYEMQICYIADKLTKESFEMIESLHGFIQLRKTENESN